MLGPVLELFALVLLYICDHSTQVLLCCCKHLLPVICSPASLSHPRFLSGVCSCLCFTAPIVFIGLPFPPSFLLVGTIDVGKTRLMFWDLGGQEELQSLWDKVRDVVLFCLIYTFVYL